jgi:tripartite ATP-independent transporter DctM subunit
VEIFFLLMLVVLMVTALTMGFPVAFALPGSAILTIGTAALSGYLFAGDADAYFAQDGAIQWLSAGVTNFRSLYWDVERDTLIAIPLFVFMGIMLERSKIAEDLLVTMAQLFGPVPGGLGISVVFVGALLAATTGIVGATVIAMGLISLPAMLRNNYSKPLATGTICASGTLGQIIPPSIVLIILADQLSSASDQASTTRKADYKAATGEFSMPSEFDITSASAGDMFMGAFVPGMILVGLYMLYILISAFLKPDTAPPVHREGKPDRQFALRVFMALIPPLTLIFAVLGSIIMGIATVNQAGAIGAIGAMIMGSYRLTAGKRGAYAPAILAVVSTAAILFILSTNELNIRNIQGSDDVIGLSMATVAVVGLLVAIGWSAWRSYVVDDTLRGVMVETAKTTSMVFIILIGAAMLTSAFRAFGGEELVRDFLTSLPGGFWSQFIVVMAVIFLLGFFLDFIEIAVVVVPIVAPILLADPSANITAVWLGVMIGLNIQTSFLTPPFGFALFYLRGVAPPEVKTLQIYRGAMAFIALQLAGLAVAGYWPSLVNYLPNRIYLTSETAPPPMNPRLQQCLEEQVFRVYDEDGQNLIAAVDRASAVDYSFLPKDRQTRMAESLDKARDAIPLSETIRQAQATMVEYEPEYRPIHTEVRALQSRIRDIEEQIETLEKARTLASRDEIVDEQLLNSLGADIERAIEQKTDLADSIPDSWEAARENYNELIKNLKTARGKYRSNVDQSYETIAELRGVIEATGSLANLESTLDRLEAVIRDEPPKQAMETIKTAEAVIDEVPGTGDFRSKVSKARRALKGKQPDPAKALALLAEAKQLFAAELEWRQRAGERLGAELADYDDAIKDTIGVRLQRRLNTELAKEVAACQSHHRDISLNF